ncbi:NAD-dependent epimerase/dehydratase family protein [Gammaproteobacteria bacterium]|jgi:nucleoside-diphosphate-sugar epimerase|nr:NAD-dependent epimerase/dehydratase family protein [Gammaproteobacteria bacterium]MDB9947890.1 NAD-dependent epimerase/dehydratase family protein [Gammaproteobacteria bacterium]|tara:strand:- start:753 stop:1682 length:930 start_codon:yes stop_codon:yes gene_type:complete
MRIAFFGASSQIAKGLIKKFNSDSQNNLYFYVRNTAKFEEWIINEKLLYDSSKIKLYETLQFEVKLDLIINCVGIGDPAKTKDLSRSIQSITKKYDEMVLSFLEDNPATKYIFFSSGIAYGNIFSQPAESYDQGIIDINSSQPEDMYAISKVNAENTHRKLSHLSIIDIRVFSYLSDEIDLSSRFLIADAIRSIRDSKILLTSADNLTRDFIGVDDLYQLIISVISTNDLNILVDAYSKAPIDKFSILDFLRESFNLKYELQDSFVALNATGNKNHYYSKNYKAGEFGYIPKLSSLEVIEEITKQVLNQ